LISKGKEYLEAKKFTQAEESFKQVREIKPGYKEELISNLLTKVAELKVEYENNRLLRKVEDIIREARREAEERKLKEKADIYLEQGKQYLEKKEFVKAKKSFQDALTIKPDYEKTKEYLSQVEKAKREVKRQKLEGLVEEGEAYLKKNEFEKAKEKFSEALKIEPEHERTRRCMQKVGPAREEYERQQLWEKAEELVDQGVEYLIVGEFNRAESVFKKAVKIVPQDKQKALESLIVRRIEKAQGEGDEGGQLLGEIKKAIDESKVYLETR